MAILSNCPGGARPAGWTEQWRPWRAWPAGQPADACHLLKHKMLRSGGAFYLFGPFWGSTWETKMGLNRALKQSGIE